MATSTTTYPKISRKLWYLLRDRLKKSIPSEVSPTFVLSVSSMAEASARSNVISPLRDLGLLDDTNKPTSLAERWRHDDDYAAVCHEIRDSVYPKSLIEAFPDADSSKKNLIQNWFMKTGQVGQAAAKMYADTYMLLCQADLVNLEDRPAAKVSPRKPSNTVQKSKPVPLAKQEISQEVPFAVPQVEHGGHRRLPAIHIDVQVHISPDTSPEQIDRIFESMAKHLGSHIK